MNARINAVVSVPTLLGFLVFLKPENTDILWFRIGLVCGFILAALLTFVSQWIRDHIIYFTYTLLLLTCSFAYLLAPLNAYEGTFVIGFLILSMYSALTIKHIWVFWVFVVATKVLAFTSFFVFPGEWYKAIALIVISIFVDILSFAWIFFRIKVEKQLGRANDLLDSILLNSPDAILVLSARDFRILRHNPNAMDLFGLGPDEKGRLSVIWDRIIKDVLTEWKQGMNFLRSQVTVKDSEDKDLMLEVLISFIHGGSKGQLLLTFRDITKMVETAKSLRLSDYILQEVEHLVIVADESGAVIYVSPAVERVLGYSRAELLGNGWWNLPLRDAAEHIAERQVVMDTLAGKHKPRHEIYESCYRAKSGEEKWVQWKDAVTHDHLMIAMGVEHTEERRHAMVRSVIFNIAAASSQVKSPIEFYRFIHLEIRKVIDTPNFYIAVYDQVKNIVYFPYYADAADTKQPFHRKAGKGLTELTIRSKKPLLASKEEILRLDEEGLVHVKGQSIPYAWLGVPLLHNDEVVGLITIQDYERPNAYTQDDLDLLTFIAGQVAHFVSKLQNDEALKISEERFRAIYNHSAVGIAQLSLGGRFKDVNNRISEIFGYSIEEILKLSPLDITHPEDVSVGQKELEEVRNGLRDSYTVEKRYIHSMGHIVHARVNVSAYREGGEIQFIISIYEDITERVKAQEETSLLFTLSNSLNTVQEVDSALEETLLILKNQGEWDYAEVIGVNASSELRVMQRHGTLPELNIDDRSHLSEPWVINHDDIYWLEKEEIGSADFKQGKWYLNAGASTMVLIPMEVEQRLEAILVLATPRVVECTESVMRFLTAVRSQLRTFLLRKLAELAQRESEERYKAITEAAFEGIVIHRHGTILQANNAFAQLFGVDQQQLVGTNLLDLAATTTDAEMLEIVVNAHGTINFQGRKSNEEIVDLEAVGRPGTWEGLPAGVIAFRDLTNEKLMEAARESARLDARFKAYVQNSTEIIFILDESPIIQYASPTLEKQTGLEAESVLGLKLELLVHPSETKQLSAVIEEVKALSGNTRKTNFRIATQDGTWRTFQASFTNLLDDQVVRGILVSAHDITELKRTEAALLENETKFRAIFSQANDAILVLQARRIIECNEMAEEMFGSPRGELIGALLHDFSPELQPDGLKSQAKMASLIGNAQDGELQYFTWKHKRANGDFFDAEISMSQIMIGERVFVQAVVRDITERLQAENALRESEKRVKAILDAIPDLMLRVSDSGSILDFKVADNQAQILKVEPKVGAQLMDLLPAEITQYLKEIDTAQFQLGEAQQFECEITIHADLHDIETRLVKSAPDEILVIIRDVTERKRTEKELIRRNFELDTFVYRASHDLKAPLNSLAGLLEILKSENDDPILQNYFAMMHKSVVKLDNFIHDLADFSRNDRAEMEFGLVDWNQLIAEALDSLKFMSASDRVQKTFEVDVQGEFHSDAIRVGIVVTNLISNAIKYQDLKRDDAFVHIKVTSRPDQAVVVITDNGIGISEEHLAKVFNLFFRASVQSYGSGMGLYIVKNTIERLKGNIEIESKVDKGTTVTVTLPSIKSA